MKRFELRRKLFHFAVGILLIVLIQLNLLNAFRLFILVILTAATFYASKKINIPAIGWLIDTFEREHYRKTFPGKGAIFFIAGAFLAVLFFPKDIAIAALTILTVGDGISSLFGMHYGRVRHPFSDSKFIEGHIVGALLAFLAVMALRLTLDLKVGVLATAIASMIALFIEGIDFKLNTDFLDDNIIVPVISGAVILLMQVLP